MAREKPDTVIAQPSCTQASYMQMLGRAQRRKPVEDAKRLANALYFAGCVVTATIAGVSLGYILAVVLLLVLP